MNESVFAIVPMKPFAEAKQRLTPILDDVSRSSLARELFTRTLDVLAGAQGIGRIAVISRDDQVLKLAREHGAWAMWEARSGLNEALEQATRVARANGANALLIIPADLPQLQISDVEHLVLRGQNAPCLVIAPAPRDEGTNALLVNPAGLIHYAFGEKSFREHLRRAEQAGAHIELYESPHLALDLDGPEDLASFGMVDRQTTNPKSAPRSLRV